MGKWFGGILTTLVVLALTSLIGAVLKGPIDELASGDRLRAQVQLSPWVPKPDQGPASADGKAKSAPPGIAGEMAKIADDMRSHSAVSIGGTYEFARIVVVNESTKKVTDANIRILSGSAPELSLVVDDNGKSRVSDKPDRIKLPDLNPGDRVGVSMWGTYLMPSMLRKDLRTYSSAGKFRISYEASRSQEEEYESGIGQFLDDWAEIIFFSVVSFTALFLGLVVAIQDSYIKNLLKSEKLVYHERERYEKDPSKFVPNYSASPDNGKA